MAVIAIAAISYIIFPSCQLFNAAVKYSVPKFFHGKWIEICICTTEFPWKKKIFLNHFHTIFFVILEFPGISFHRSFQLCEGISASSLIRQSIFGFLSSDAHYFLTYFHRDSDYITFILHYNFIFLSWP